MPRPVKPESEKKSYSISPVRMTEEEFLLFHDLVLKSGLNRSDFIKHCIFNKKITVKQQKKYSFQYINELKSVGNNLNQIARKFNTTNQLNIPALDDTLAAINHLLLKAIHDAED